MINSRRLEDLLPTVQARAARWIAECERQGVPVLVTSTYRDNESQAAIYAQGRTTPGKIVTNAKAGESLHNYRVAVDFVPLVGGKPDWEDAAKFAKAGQIAESQGMEWAGRWKSFKELAHVQFTGGLSLADFKAGKVPA